MQSDLLKKEDEFYKENEKLELKRKELMKKVNDVMRIQDGLIKETLRTGIEFNRAKTNNCTIKDRQPLLEFGVVEDDQKNEDLNIPNSVGEMGKRGVIHFYKSKIKSLQEENLHLHNESKKKIDEIKKIQKEKQNVMEEKDKWFSCYNTTKNTIGKLESQISSLTSKCQSKDSEIISLKKDLDQVKKESKNFNVNLNNCEVRLNRAYEENEKLKAVVKLAKEEEKEIKESYKKQINDLTTTVKQIEQHKIELLNGFKKQLQLIDNLKKQKMYLETYKVAELSESEYLKILDWKLN